MKEKVTNRLKLEIPFKRKIVQGELVEVFISYKKRIRDNYLSF